MKLLLQLCVLALLLGSTIVCSAAPSLVDYYLKALSADPQNPTLRYHLGVALLNQGQNAEAIKAFRRAYPMRSDDSEINFNLALAYSRINDPDSALIYLNQVATFATEAQSDIYPLDTVYFNLVVLYEQQGRLDDAVILLKRLLQNKPESLDYLRMLGAFQLRLGHIDEAILLFGEYLKVVPDDNEIREYVFATLFNRGLKAYGKEDYVLAASQFERALNFMPASTDSMYYLTLLDYQQGRYQRVAEQLPQFFKRLGDEQREAARSVLFNTALMLKQENYFNLAESALSPLSSGDSPRAKDLVLLGGIELKTGEYALARQHYLRALELDPDFGSVAEGIQVAEKGAFEEFLNAAAAAFVENDLIQVKQLLAQAAEIYPQNNRLKIYQLRLAKASREKWLVLQGRAQEFEDQLQYPEAISALREGLKLAPSEAQLLNHEVRLIGKLAARIDALNRRGTELYNQGDFVAARLQFAQLVQLSPDHQVGNAYVDKIDRALQQQSQRALAAGNVALARNDLVGAGKAYQAAIVAWPTELAAQAGLKRIASMRANRVTETLLQVRHLQAEGRLLIARQVLISELERLSNASLETELLNLNTQIEARQIVLKKQIRKAIQQQHYNLAAQMLAKAGVFGTPDAEIVQLTSELQTAQTGEVASQLALARQNMVSGNFDAALNFYRRALDIDPKNEEALAGLKSGRDALSNNIDQYLAAADKALRAGSTTLARQRFRDALALDPHQQTALAGLRQIAKSEQSGLTSADLKHIYLEGIEFYTEGEYRQAISAWQQILELDPSHEKAKMNIDKAERKLRQIQERQSG